jgi:acyl carrier protein
MASVSERLKKITAEYFGVDESKIEPSTNFIEDLNADSLDLVDFVLTLEEKFDITIPDEEAEKITTFQEALDYVEEHAKEQ